MELVPETWVRDLSQRMAQSIASSHQLLSSHSWDDECLLKQDVEKFCCYKIFIVFLRSLYCHFEKNPIFLRKMSFREKSYFFFRKRQDFLPIFPVCTQLTLWVILIYILLYNNCFLIGLSPRIPRNPGTAAAHIISNFRSPSNLKSWRSPTLKNYTDTPHAYQNTHTKFHWL